MTLIYQHELPNLPGKSVKGVLVEYGPGGYGASPSCPATATASAANASETDPAKLLAVYVVDTNETELTTCSKTERVPTANRTALRGPKDYASLIRPTPARSRLLLEYDQ